MRIVRYIDQGSAPKTGLLFGDKIVALQDIVADAPDSTRAVIAAWDRIAPRLAGAEAAPGVALSAVKLLAPVDAPQKLPAIGLNYADHIEEARHLGLTIPTEQVWFCKQPGSLNGPFDGIELPKVSDQLDYEVELVAVIGKRGRHISAADAPNHVFGYAVGNDVTVRDWQRKTSQWMVGKSFDTHGPVGPCIVTADEIGDPHRLGIRCLVNGELRQNSNTRHLVFNIWAQIAELSQAMALEPGDLIFSGTPGGVGIGMTPPSFLKVGDVVRCEIDEIGAIENTVIPEA